MSFTQFYGNEMNIENYFWLLLLVAALGMSYIAVSRFRKKKNSHPSENTLSLQESSTPELPEESVSSQKLQEPATPNIVIEPESKSMSEALLKTRRGWIARLAESLRSKDVSRPGVLDEVEEILVSADIGVKTSGKLLEYVKESIEKDVDKSHIFEKISGSVLEIFEKVKSRGIAKNSTSPQVIMFVGVNGVGKTTTIGKLACQLQESGSKVILAAGDTFRAAAGEQLEIWANKAGAKIIRGPEGSDPSSVLFEAVKIAKSENADFVLCDTAGRLHTKINLMDELKKVHRVLGKACDGAPHEVLLVVDATTGQNAIEQARQFMAATPLTGVVLTKLDGTAKGGIAIGISDELLIPIRYIGVGEKASDLREFSPDEFVAALFETNQGDLHEQRV